jgi:hypothetical protein
VRNNKKRGEKMNKKRETMKETVERLSVNVNNLLTVIANTNSFLTKVEVIIKRAEAVLMNNTAVTDNLLRQVEDSTTHLLNVSSINVERLRGLADLSVSNMHELSQLIIEKQGEGVILELRRLIDDEGHQNKKKD